MKGVPIKFRGRFWLKGLEPCDVNTRLSDGDFVFGGYASMKFLFDDDDGDYIIQNDSTAFLVYPNSVSQLVGYDVDGKEIYEGDEILDANNIDTQSTVCCNVITAKLYANVNLRCFKLKKE